MSGKTVSAWGPGDARWAKADPLRQRSKGTADAYLAEAMASDREDPATFGPKSLRATQPA